MKNIFLLILLVHGSFHLLEFGRSHFKSKVVKLQNHIPRSIGWLWLICGFLFLGVLLLKLLEINGWPFFALAAVILSQTLIILFWKKAKFGSLLNVPIVLGSLSHLGIFDLDLL